MVVLTCVVCTGTWNGDVGDVDCPHCGGPKFIRITGETITVTSIEDIDDALEVFDHDKSDVETNLDDSQYIISLEQVKHDGYQESIENYEHDIAELNQRKQYWIKMGIE